MCKSLNSLLFACLTILPHFVQQFNSLDPTLVSEITIGLLERPLASPGFLNFQSVDSMRQGNPC